MKRLLLGSLFVAMTSGAHAQVFTGQTVNYQYLFPELTSNYSNAANGNYLVGPGVEFSNIVDGYGTMDFHDSGFLVSFTNGTSFTPSTFNGFRVSDVFGTIGSFTSFVLTSNTGVAGTPVLTFDADNLYVNWQGLGFGGGDLAFSVNSVNAIPEPETYALLLAGLGLLGLAGRRRRQKALATA